MEAVKPEMDALERLQEERPELDRLITDASVTAARIRELHAPEGFGEEQHCGLCALHGESEWPCLTVKALDPWRWNKDGVNLYE